MKISNIKAILENDLVTNSLKVGILDNYSQQCEQVVSDCYEKYLSPAGALGQNQKTVRSNRKNLNEAANILEKAVQELDIIERTKSRKK